MLKAKPDQVSWGVLEMAEGVLSESEALAGQAPFGRLSTEVKHSIDGERNLPRWFSLVFSVISRGMAQGALIFQLPDGRAFRAGGSVEGPEGWIIVRDNRMFGRLARGGALGFAEAYLDDLWRTPDLQTVLDAALLNNENVARGFDRMGLREKFERLRHWLRRNTPAQAKRNIEAHYDLGNRFYETWLDPSMTYSSALFERDDQTLEEAQRAKYRSICDRMGLRQGDHVLEIGCGWGGFAEFAARERGARVTGLTISPAQLEFAQKRMFEQGLADRVEVVLRDYREEQGAYDGVASIEMFEAVGEKYWPSYFKTVHDRLRPGGRASLQIITIADDLFASYRRRVDFIQKYVFPGGMLPSPSSLKEQTAKAGLQFIDSIQFGASYSRTLRIWMKRFHEAWDKIQELPGARPFDARFRRIWDFYLASCAACFEAGTTDVTQVALRRA
ncbi:MAG: cyclopropane-fatty-acyl-phospholipid synthase family protein [Neomegalonema sp.]|nr:cyclopropane-fatty-acyl-phospholipid synthase family protein [Neomegalonema sp.]